MREPENRISLCVISSGTGRKASILVPQATFLETCIGDMFYVMYDAGDGRILNCYEVSRYDLGLGLELRQL